MSRRFGGPLAHAAVLALALAAGGCESTQQKSASLERVARHERLAQRGVSVSRQNPEIEVLATEVLRGRESSAVVVHLRDLSSKPIQAAPIAVAVTDAGGATVYRNDAAGEDPSLTRVSLQPGAEAVWVDDQVHGDARPTGASAEVGEGSHPTGAVPKLSIEGLHATGEGEEAGAEGNVENRSSTTQEDLVVFVLARKGNRIVAAGRAVLAEVPPGASDSFQVYFVGDPTGARLQASAPATVY